MERTAAKCPAFILMIVLGGCTSPTVYDRFQEFRTHPTQESLDPVDNGGVEGASLLIGFLETHATWELTEFPDHSAKQIAITTIYEFGNGARPLFDRVTRMAGASLWIKNPDVLTWAELTGEIHMPRSPQLQPRKK